MQEYEENAIVLWCENTKEHLVEATHLQKEMERLPDSPNGPTRRWWIRTLALLTKICDEIDKAEGGFPQHMNTFRPDRFLDQVNGIP